MSCTAIVARRHQVDCVVCFSGGWHHYRVQFLFCTRSMRHTRSMRQSTCAAVPVFFVPRHWHMSCLSQRASSVVETVHYVDGTGGSIPPQECISDTVGIVVRFLRGDISLYGVY